MTEFTRILNRAEQGDSSAAGELLPLVYDELRRLAAHKMAQEAVGHTLQPTALVHEAWLKLGGPTQPAWGGRAQFFAAAGEAMRRILIDHARAKMRQKRGGDADHLPLEESILAIHVPSGELLAVHEALDRLAAEDRVSAELVKLRYFVGMTMPEAADALGLPLRNAERVWTMARAWLRRELARGEVQERAPGAG